MKKLMIAAAIVCAAIASQASSVNWTSTSLPYFLDTASLAGNASYGVGTAKMKTSGYTFQYVLAVTGAGEANGTVAYNIGGKFSTLGITVGGDSAISAGSTYNYVITITTSLTGIGKQGGWDYSAAVATTTLSGTFQGATGTSAIQTGVPAEWTVSGAVQGEEPTPEPTSGLLMLLGMAGLALRRKQK